MWFKFDRTVGDYNKRLIRESEPDGLVRIIGIELVTRL